MTKEEVKEQFGFNPETIGIRYRGWWIVEQIETEEKTLDVQYGDLCIKSRDGAGNPIDLSAERYGHYLGSIEDGFDTTYRYYFYRKINNEE